VIRNTMTGCSSFSFFLEIFMFFQMFFFSSWVHGVSYRFHALNIPFLSFIIGSWKWMDNQGYFKASLRRRLLLRLKWICTVFHGCYHGYMLHHLQLNHRISSLLILASCMSAYNRLPLSLHDLLGLSCNSFHMICLMYFILS
jgi:hypothetical protein